MTPQYVTDNYFEPGGHRIIVRGTMDREGAPVLPLATLQAALLQHYHIVPAAVSAVATHAAVALGAAPKNVTTAITNPDVPRNVTVKGNQAGVAGNVVITGTAIDGSAISETIALNGAAEVAGVKAFKTVTAIALPVEVNAGTDTVSIGRGELFGLPHVLVAAGCMQLNLFNLAADAGTTAVSADIEGNTYDAAGVADGAKPIDLWYLV